MSRGFLRDFAYLSIQGSHTLIHVNDAFCCSCMTRRCVLYDKHRLLQWLSLFFSVSPFFLSLVALTAVLGCSGTPKAYFC
jgi:hypothetical protein